MIYYNILFNTYELNEKQEKALRRALKDVKLIKRVSISDVNKKQLLGGNKREFDKI